MAGEVEERITLQADSLPTGSISFGRFELESLSWERRSSFSHNRYLEEVEKYSTPGSVTKKKEYFEAHFKKKALLRQVPEENQNEKETQHPESIEFSWGNEYAPAVRDEHEAVELQMEDISTTEISTKFSSFNSENFVEPFNEPLSSDVTLQSQSGDNIMQLEEGGGLWAIEEDKTLSNSPYSIKQAENGNSSKTCKTKKKNESIQMKTQNVSLKTSETVELKVGRSQSRAHLSIQQICKKPLSNKNSVTYGKFKKLDKQNMSAKEEKRITSKVSSPSAENGNYKITTSRNVKTSSEIKSEEGVKTKKVEVNLHPVDRKGSDARQPVNRVKLVSKEDDKQSSIVFNFKSSERAEKRKEYNLKLEKRLHAKAAEMNEIQAKTEVVKEAEMKQLRRNLNFKATPMPSFYHESSSRVSDIKKASTIPARSREKSTPSPSSNQDCEHSCSQPISPSISSRVDDGSSSIANQNSATKGAWKHSVKKAESLKEEGRRKSNASLNQVNGMGKKGERKSRIRAGVRGIVGGSVAVHVAS